MCGSRARRQKKGGEKSSNVKKSKRPKRKGAEGSRIQGFEGDGNGKKLSGQTKPSLCKLNAPREKGRVLPQPGYGRRRRAGGPLPAHLGIRRCGSHAHLHWRASTWRNLKRTAKGMLIGGMMFSGCTALVDFPGGKRRRRPSIQHVRKDRPSQPLTRRVGTGATLGISQLTARNTYLQSRRNPCLTSPPPWRILL